MKIKLKDIVILAMLAALMCVGDFAMEWLPNVHFVGVLIVVTTAIYRTYALFPIYTYVIIQGIMGGFSVWWVPYLYIWTVLWGAIMLIPKKLSEKVKHVLYILFCALHGFLFGVLYSPMQAIFFGLDLKGTLAWIAAGFYFDAIHGTGNLILGIVFIYPIIKVLKFGDRYAK